MSSQTSLVAKQCRLQTWALQIQECQNRPKDMSVDDWCIQHNITKTNYYYRLRRVREACLESMNNQPTFVELDVPEPKDPISHEPMSASAVIHAANGPLIEIHENASSDFLRKLIGACAYAK